MNDAIVYINKSGAVLSLLQIFILREDKWRLFKKVALTVGITEKSILFKERNSKLALQHGAKHDTCQHLSLLFNTSQHTSTRVNTSPRYPLFR